MHILKFDQIIREVFASEKISCNFLSDYSHEGVPWGEGWLNGSQEGFFGVFFWPSEIGVLCRCFFEYFLNWCFSSAFF